MFSKGPLRKTIGYGLLILFIGTYISITAFNHTHQLENGVVIVHSHPFKSAPNAPVHKHSTNVLILIHSLNNFLSTALLIACFFETAGAVFSKILKETPTESLYARQLNFSRPLRAPPYR